MQTVTHNGVTYKVLNVDGDVITATPIKVRAARKPRTAKPTLFDVQVVHANSTRDSLFHVHAVGCNDLGKYGRRSIGSAEIDAENGLTSFKDLVTRYYDEGDFDYDASTDEFNDYASQFKVFPCTKLS